MRRGRWCHERLSQSRVMAWIWMLRAAQPGQPAVAWRVGLEMGLEMGLELMA